MKYLKKRLEMYLNGLVSYDDIMGYIQCMIDNGLITNSDAIRVISLICNMGGC